MIQKTNRARITCLKSTKRFKIEENQVHKELAIELTCQSVNINAVQVIIND